MPNFDIDPVHWNRDFLVKQGEEVIHQLALSANAVLITYRLVLGRCLLAAEESGMLASFGCSSMIHYATHFVGLSKKMAYDVVRVARALEDLPLLTQAAEEAAISWSKLREVVTKATPETELYWLKLCGRFSAQKIQKLVSRTPFGGIPGDPRPDGSSAEVTELRLQLDTDRCKLVKMGLIALSRREGRAVSLAEAVEWLFADLLSGAQLVELEEKTESERRGSDRDGRAARALAAETVPTWEGLVAYQQETVGGSEVVTRWRNPESPRLTDAQRKEIFRRDGYRCRTPGCCNRIWLEVHHIEFYCRGGLTTPGNVILLCSKCHKHVHQKKLFIEGSAPDQVVFRDAQGRDLERQYQGETAYWIGFWFDWGGRKWLERIFPAWEEPPEPGSRRRIQQFLGEAVNSG